MSLDTPFSASFVVLFMFTICNVIIVRGVRNENRIVYARPCTEEIRQNNCSLPVCRCSSEDIPGNLESSQVPQMVFLTFDDDLNKGNFDLYQNLLLNRKNPNGYPITMTFFVSHEYTNYSMVHELWRNGHEIALHSITHKPYIDYWRALNESMWRQEIMDQRLQMAKFARIPATEIRGARAPFLQGGGDAMYSALASDTSHDSSGLSWESSRASSNLLWPYTNHFTSIQECGIPPCPEGAYPDFWTVPMIKLVAEYPCAMADGCTPVPNTENETFKLLEKNFLKHYNGNRAPFGIFTHSAWINGDDEIMERQKGYVKFLDYLGTLKDTYIVSISRAIEWIKNPTPVDKLSKFPDFQVQLRPTKCSTSSNCGYRFSQDEERWFSSCVSECPRVYPWLGNPLGE